MRGKKRSRPVATQVSKTAPATATAVPVPADAQPSYPGETFFAHPGASFARPGWVTSESWRDALVYRKTGHW